MCEREGDYLLTMYVFMPSLAMKFPLVPTPLKENLKVQSVYFP